MAVQLTKFDRDLAGGVILKFQEGKEGSGLSTYSVPFQFPPRILSDNKKGEWNETPQPGFAPTATYNVTGPRVISLSFTYVVGGDWDIDTISGIVKKMRGYFNRATVVADSEALVVFFSMWAHTPIGQGEKTIWPELMTCRLEDVNVKHSETIVSKCTNGSPSTLRAYPLRTDITTTIKVWSSGTAQFKAQYVTGLKVETPEWF